MSVSLLVGCGTAKKKLTIDDLSMQLAELQNANAYSNSKLEELSNSVYSLQEVVDANKTIIAQLRDGAIEREEVVKMSTALVKTAKKAKTFSGSPTKEFNASFSKFKRKNYTGALSGFRRFTRRYPQHKRASDAIYWMGEIYFDQKQYRAAIGEYGKIPEKYPIAKKIDSAILKQALCHLKLGEAQKARAKFKEIIEIYPNSSSALIAKQQMQRLK
jgi:tol-pal system protein YbgF